MHNYKLTRVQIHTLIILLERGIWSTNALGCEWVDQVHASVGVGSAQGGYEHL